jgi:O-antigen ligase
MVSSMAIPFAFALFELRRTLARLALAAMTFLIVAVVNVHTRSRSGQLAFLAVLGLYLMRRLRWLGVGMAVLATLPILLLGGRSGSEADESSELRLGYWAAAIQMARDSPLVGVGMSMFTDHQPQTAHSSVMLILGETGLPGLFFWTAMMYAAAKIAVVILRRETTPEAHPAQVWAAAMLAALAAFTTSAFFLSLAYHYVLWILLGLVGALYAATERHDPRLQVRFRLRDLALITAIDVVLVVSIHIYTRSQGF